MHASHDSNFLVVVAEWLKLKLVLRAENVGNIFVKFNYSSLY